LGGQYWSLGRALKLLKEPSVSSWLMEALAWQEKLPYKIYCRKVSMASDAKEEIILDVNEIAKVKPTGPIALRDKRFEVRESRRCFSTLGVNQCRPMVHVLHADPGDVMSDENSVMPLLEYNPSHEAPMHHHVPIHDRSPVTDGARRQASKS
jgi:hypothetical protein